VISKSKLKLEFHLELKSGLLLPLLTSKSLLTLVIFTTYLTVKITNFYQLSEKKNYGSPYLKVLWLCNGRVIDLPTSLYLLIILDNVSYSQANIKTF
jgi:hypothetical protein